MVYINSFTILYGLIPFLFFLLIKGKISKSITSLLPFIILVFISAIYEFIFSILLRWNVSNWFIIYCVISFFVIYYLFNSLIVRVNPVLKFSSLILYIILLMFLILKFDNQDFLKICYFIDSYITVFVFVCSIIWFKKIFKELQYESLWDSPFFYVVSGLILYYFGTFFLFLMTELIYRDNNYSFQYYWLLNIILNLVLRTLLIVGIWKARVK